MYKLLVADDEPIIRRGIRTLVDFEEFSITEALEAADGKEALEILRREKIDILFADVNMPGMDGLTLAKAARELNPDIKVVIITGYNYFDYALTALKAGVDDFVLKPISKSDVSALLAKLVADLRTEQQQKGALSSIGAIKSLSGADGDVALKSTLIKVIDANCSDSSFSLNKLAQHVNLSAGYLSTVFKRLLGIPFQDYLVSVRLERAKILLLTTDLKNYQIADRVGFEDANYFSTSFKRRYGEPPSRYKETVTGGGTT
ncbi:MAG: response regulator [Negativicutes bacterium]|nr:response regulator [Negativicutes bacterium]